MTQRRAVLTTLPQRCFVRSLAYYAAREYYNVIRELPSGKGFEGYVGDALLVGVSYDRKTRHHECRIRPARV